ncbi:O-antigen ligase family protein [Salisaeta longa]|uniref:O-antigen ligase family protein n=1 Tax=Salisaeta longa TaxID=503170 RepID=UPI0012FC6D62|nr:hypothetical protein [Salisaeta longa]
MAKDVALIGAAVLFGQRHGFHLARPLRRTFLPVLWGAFVFVVVLQAFNFNTPSLAVGVLGVRSYLLYSVLLILLPVALERVRRPEHVITAIVLVGVVPVLLLGWYQFYQPVGSWINQYVAEDMAEVGVLSNPRITGTFSYIGGMGAFLSFALFLGMGILLAGLKHKHRWYQWLGGGLLLLALIVAPMNGSRSVVYGVFVPLPFILYASLRRQKKGGVLAGIIVLLALGGVVASESEWAAQGWETIEYRIENASDQDTRIQTMLLDPFYKLSVGGLTGYGTGATHQAAGALSASGRVSIPGVYYEGELGRVIIELGIVGGALFVLLKLFLAWVAWQAMVRARTAWRSLLSIVAFGKLFLSAGAGMIVFNHIAGALYWICAGCAVWVWSRQEIERNAYRAA